MTSLIEIPSCSALHIPAPNTNPVPLAEGTLVLTLIPANPPTHPSSTITLSVGTASFPLLPISPVQKIQSTNEHPNYIFTPVPADGGESVGRVKIAFKDSKSQSEWEASEALSAKFEDVLKSHGLWDEKLLFVNDEFEKPAGSPRQGWGETIAGSLLGASQAIANRLNTYTDRHIATTNPTQPAPPTESVKSTASTISSTTTTISNYAVTGSSKLSNLMQDVGKTIGSKLPETIVKPIQPIPEGEKSDFRKIAEGGWTQVAAAAKGVVGAAVVVGGAVSGAGHRAVEHNFGKEAEGVAQDVGQTGADVVTTGVAASAIAAPSLHGINAGTGVYESQQKQ